FVGWGGAQRWLRSDLPFNTVQTFAQALAGYATLFRGGDKTGEVFAPLAPALLVVHQRLKQAFDPKGIFNPHRMYKDL
ncbi:MAG: FAD-linked oxidase C-terminal domain-containing protein, partial [Mariprofundaceae bacterium]|nr:FAD-linked oxidase C-terminal domain-containing protein [Mariprofundaceae bacterium]